MDEITINTAYYALAEATREFTLAGMTATETRTALDVAKAIGLATGSIEGKNAELREASARDVLAAEYAAVERATQTEAQARLALDLARIEVERVKSLLRLREILPVELAPVAGAYSRPPRLRARRYGR